MRIEKLPPKTITNFIKSGTNATFILYNWIYRNTCKFHIYNPCNVCTHEKWVFFSYPMRNSHSIKPYFLFVIKTMNSTNTLYTDLVNKLPQLILTWYFFFILNAYWIQIVNIFDLVSLKIDVNHFLNLTWLINLLFEWMK